MKVSLQRSEGALRRWFSHVCYGRHIGRASNGTPLAHIRSVMITCTIIYFIIIDHKAEKMPFASALERAIHFKKHGSEFAATTELQYERMADAFMAAPMTLSMRECIRPNGTDRLRINVANNHFGVGIVASPMVRTFYIVPVHR